MSTSRTREKADGELFKSTGIDDNATSTAITIDASENVLVGKTTATSSTVGIENRANGFLVATRDGGNPAVFNRTSSDGDIVDFRKDNTSVGSIGTVSGDVTIDGGSEHTGLRFEAAQITPRHNGAYSNNWTGLGTASNRFKDLYLGGGIYLGGTGAANKLQDYETGTWTSSFANSSITDGSYVKIGRMVYILGKVSCTGAGGSGTTISGLPFAPANVAGQQGCGIVGYHNMNVTEVYSILVSQSSSTFTFRLASTAIEVGAGANFRFNLSYPTNS